MTPILHGESPTAVEPNVEMRTRFRRELEALEDQLRAMEAEVRRLLTLSLLALATNDAAVCDAVIEGDEDVDRHYLHIERAIAGAIALQQPVASDLRLLIAMDHAALHLERIGDEAVNVARAVKESRTLVPSPEILRRLHSMGEVVVSMGELAIEAFTRRDATLCERVALLDQDVDMHDRGTLEALLAVACDEGRRAWAARMNRVSRHLERAADHAVDIAEQAWFVVTGELREFSSDAG
jgi:phosphate transport system protein